jgi:hypothetical protein
MALWRSITVVFWDSKWGRDELWECMAHSSWSEI